MEKINLSDFMEKKPEEYRIEVSSSWLYKLLNQRDDLANEVFKLKKANLDYKFKIEMMQDTINFLSSERKLLDINA